MFKPGDKKPVNSGRKKGVTNKSKPLKKAKAILEEAGLNPIEEAIKLLPLLSPRDQINAWFEIHSWTESKPKTESTPQEPGSPDDAIEQDVTDADLLKVVR